MNAQDIDWTKAPEGYDYFIVDKQGEHPADFHRAEESDIFGTMYIDKRGYNWIGGDGRLEIFKRPETKVEEIPTHLRCVESHISKISEGDILRVIEKSPDTGSYEAWDTNDGTWYVGANTLSLVGIPSVVFEPYEETPEEEKEVTHLRCLTADDSGKFTVGKTYRVIKVDRDGDYVIAGECGSGGPWYIDADDLSFVGKPTVGTFEVVSGETGVADSVSAEEPEKTQPEFGDIVHVGGVAYVFVRLDSDGDHVLYDEDGDLRYTQLDEMEEYAEGTLREKVLKDLKASRIGVVEDHPAYDIDITVPDLIDFILAYKDNWRA